MKYLVQDIKGFVGYEVYFVDSRFFICILNSEFLCILIQSLFVF